MADVRKRSDLWIKTGIGLYACICIVLFIWIRFPYDSLKYRVEEALSGVLHAPVTLGHIEPSLLGGFRIQGITIRDNQVADSLTVSPRPWQILRGSLGFGYHADLGTGSVKGRMRLPFKKSRRPMELTVEMANVDLEGLSKVFPANMSPTGTVSGEFSIMAPRDSFEKAIGNLTLSWINGSLPLGMPSLPFDALTFTKLDVDSTIDNGLMNLEKAEFTGDFTGTMTGSIRLSQDVRRSRLNITGEVTLPEAMRTALGADSATPGQGSRFSLRGSLEKPRFRMLGSYAGRMARRPAPTPAPSVQRPSRTARDIPERTRPEVTPPPQATEPSEREDAEDLDLEPEEVELQQPIEPEGEGHE